MLAEHPHPVSQPTVALEFESVNEKAVDVPSGAAFVELSAGP